jgi:hypothetical protein
VSHSSADNLCDVAPSRFDRLERDEYFTIDAGWIVPALCRAVQVEGPVLEPCAGRGHMVRELRGLGLVVCAADLYAYPESLVPDINTGADIFDLKSLAGYRFVVTNLPYREQDAILAYLIPIAARDRAHVAVLARSEWSSAAARRALIHENARFAGEVRLTKRPEWVRLAIASPRHWFSWFVWSSEPRAPSEDPFLRFAAPAKGSAALLNREGQTLASRRACAAGPVTSTSARVIVRAEDYAISTSADRGRAEQCLLLAFVST